MPTKKKPEMRGAFKVICYPDGTVDVYCSEANYVIRSIAAGKVVSVSENTVVIDHGDGYQTRCSHLADRGEKG